MAPWNFPNKQLVLDDLSQVKQTQYYSQDLTFKQKIDGLYSGIMSSTVDAIKLDDFFKFNDKLDQSRNIHLKNYIPELEACRPTNFPL
jgi:hypothetical protein